MKNNEYNIGNVNFYYNGDNEKFNDFLVAVIRDYISEDKISPDIDINKNDESA